MSATTVLATTLLSQTIGPGDSKIILADLTGIYPNRITPISLYIDRELMGVETFTGVGNEIVVRRGEEGTVATRHGSNSVVTIGRADQFYAFDPQGLPQGAPLVSPYINVRTGVQWAVQGDESGPNVDGRTWQPITTTQNFGALGIRQNSTTTPT